VDWRPNRWIDENEELIQPEPGTFLPWISGPRVCPGKKFAQVEFVSVIARLFQKYRVRPTVEDGETAEKVSKRIMEVMDDSEVDVTLHMNHPEEIKLLWEEVA
jgi:cytochrome P450